jgi:hypothetical protein
MAIESEELKLIEFSFLERVKNNIKNSSNVLINIL